LQDILRVQVCNLNPVFLTGACVL